MNRRSSMAIRKPQAPGRNLRQPGSEEAPFGVSTHQGERFAVGGGCFGPPAQPTQQVDAGSGQDVVPL